MFISYSEDWLSFFMRENVNSTYSLSWEHANVCCLSFLLLCCLSQLFLWGPWGSIFITPLRISIALYMVICKQYTHNKCLLLIIKCKFTIFTLKISCILMEVIDLFLNLCCIFTCNPLSLLGKSSVLIEIGF